MEVITKSALETQKLGEKIGCDLKPGTILALYGELGSGKTTFIQGIAKGLGIKKRVISPTFVFMKQYGSHFYHIDLYRIEKLEDTKSLGLEEIFTDLDGIIAIEWAEKIKKILPKKRIDIYFDYISENQRKIRIKNEALFQDYK